MTKTTTTTKTPAASKRSRAKRPEEPAADPSPAAPEVVETARPATKLDTIIALLRRPAGASLAELVEATGWQPHSVRGALAGAIARKLGAKVVSSETAGVRTYRAPTKSRR